LTVTGIGPLRAVAPRRPDNEMLDAGAEDVSGRLSFRVIVRVLVSPGLAFDCPIFFSRKEEETDRPRISRGLASEGVDPKMPKGMIPMGFLTIPERTIGIPVASMLMAGDD
jgi:hypothetical protein